MSTSQQQAPRSRGQLGVRQPVRSERFVSSASDIAVRVRSIFPADAANGSILLCLHGARVPSGPSFDLPVEGGSLVLDLAAQGIACALMDVRGYGDSTRMPSMSEPSAGRAPMVRIDEVFRDIDAVVDDFTKRGNRVVLLGWATGALWAGHFASLRSQSLAGLVLYNPVYGGVDGHPTWGAGSPLEDVEYPGRFARSHFGAYRVCDAADLLEKWDASIPVSDKAAWRDPSVAAAYVAETLASDPAHPTIGSRPAFRAPSGAVEDTFYAMRGRQLYDASLIKVPTLIIRCELDFLAREAEAVLLRNHLVSAPRVEYETIEGATHYAHLDRPEHGRNRVIDTLIQFMRSVSP
ncbi:alpha/beta hydrolase [Bradyrhizobium ottawaense]|uniref:alpha/beta hydrolase n=1 Tax=Bradyrhizobium ottawaense TaxID=931866 RepID=UPI0038373AA9